ncbi:hypothetical protein D3C84_1090760 [compost metagenome]
MAMTAKHHQEAHKHAQEKLRGFAEPLRGLKRDQVIEATKALFEKAAEFKEQNKREKALDRGPQR